MVQESNFYRLYKLANKDRIQSFRASLLSVIIIGCFALGSLFTVGLVKSFSFGTLNASAICWVLGFSFLIIFALTSSGKDFFLWTIAFSISSFLPLLLNHQLFATPQISKIALIEITILFVLFSFARLRIRGEYNALVNLHWWRIVYRGTFFLTLALVLIVGSLAFFQLRGADFWKVSARASTKLWDYLASSTTKSLPQGIIPPSFSGTVDDILKAYLKKQSSSLGIEGEISSEATKPLLQAMKDNLSRMLSYPVKGNETIPHLLTNWFQSRWSTFPLTFKISIGFLIFLLALTLLNLVNFIFSFLLIIVSGLLLQLLTALKYVKISHKGVEKEILEL